MGMLLALFAYGAYAVFTGRIAWRILIVLESSKHSEGRPSLKRTPITLPKAMGDMFLFSRLFHVNPRLWIGEWVFHLSFLLVLLRHLRYVVRPVPEWVSALQPVGICAGYVLPVSLLYILAMKLEVEEKKYVSSFNFFLLAIVFFMSITGLLMRTLARPDIAAVKNYMIGIFIFAPSVLPDGAIFGIHFITALVLLAYLPTHTFSAPFSVMEARRREDGLWLLMHED